MRSGKARPENDPRARRPIRTGPKSPSKRSLGVHYILRFLPAVVVLTVAAASAPAQDLNHFINLEGVGADTNDNPFGLGLSPDGSTLWVPVSGAPTWGDPATSNNNVVARYDTATYAYMGSTVVGWFPNNVVVSDTTGYVSVSTDGTIAVVDAATGALTATVTIPNWGFSAYPFGLALSGDGSRLYVSTLDGQDAIYVLDTTTLVWLNAETIYVPGGAGRLAVHGATLIAGLSAYLPDWSGGVSRMAFIDLLSGTQVVHTLKSAAAGSFSFPGLQDAVVSPDGLAYVAGYEVGHRIYVFDASTGDLLRTIPTGAGLGYYQGIALDETSNTLVVMDQWTSELIWIDRGTEQVLAVTDASSLLLDGANEAVFAGGQGFVAFHYANGVGVFDVPAGSAGAPALDLTASDTTPDLGGSVTVALASLDAGALAGVLYAWDDGPTGAFSLGGSAIGIAMVGSGPLSADFAVPNDAALAGFQLFLQGVRLGTAGLEVTNQMAVVIQ